MEVDRLSLTLEKDHVIGALFRTIQTVPEKIPGKSIDYQTREDLIQFNVEKRRYRITKSTFLDSNGKIVLTEEPGDKKEWSRWLGHTSARLLSAAGQLRPLGVWTVASARLATGEPVSEEDVKKLGGPIGSWVRFDLDRVSFRGESCSKPAYEKRSVSNEETLKRLGVPLSSLAIQTDRIDGLMVRCASDGTNQTYTIVLFPSEDQALMLWQGVFLELKRPKNVFRP